MSLELLSSLFLSLSLLMAIIVIGLFTRYLTGRARITAITVFLIWLLYAGILGARGIIAAHVPPGPAFLLIPFFVFMAAFLVRRPSVKVFASTIPATLLIGLQVFRVLVEFVLHGLYQNRLIPRMLTFEGANFDILIGFSAPVIAWLYASGRINAAAVKLWSWAGIAMLANVMIRFVLTFTGTIRTEIPNTGIGMFPFTFLPGFLAPLALSLHVLVLRSLSKPVTLNTRTSEYLNT